MTTKTVKMVCAVLLALVLVGTSAQGQKAMYLEEIKKAADRGWINIPRMIENWKRSSQSYILWGYNPEAKAYFGFRYYSDGWTDFPKGWLNGKTWTFVFEDEHRGGKAQRRQVTQVLESPTVLTFQWDRSVEGAPWTTTAVGKCSKAK